jgi:signal transduction histidine kinase
MSPKEEAIAAIDRARSEMEEALGKLEQFPMFDSGNIGYAAHALQSYLTVINGTTQLLEKRFDTSSDTEVKRWLQGLQHTTELMSHTVAQLMNTASNAPSLKLAETDLSLLVERACAYYRHVAARKQISILFRGPAKAAYVWVDRVALAAALDNLLSNAIKYSPLGKIVQVEIKSTGEQVRCEVRDEGPGISLGEQGRLFHKGVRLSAVPTGGEPSTGFGLAVAWDLVRKIGGDLRCESKPGSGACFIISLPTVAKSTETGRSTERITIPVEWSSSSTTSTKKNGTNDPSSPS